MTTTQAPTPKIPSQDALPETTNDLASVVTIAAHQFESVSGRAPESIVGAHAHDDGARWSVLVETVEMDGIPDSTSMLAIYRVDLDEHCRLVSFQRLRRYVRSRSDL